MGQPIKFYTDEHIAKAVIRGLRQRGADVLTAIEAAMIGALDPEHLERARAEGRTLLTQDQDYLRLHAAGVAHAGIVYSPQGTSISTIIRGVTLIFQVLDADDMQGHLEYVTK